MLAVPRPAVVVPSEKGLDFKGQLTRWKDEKEMERATKFHYPVLLGSNESIPEISLNINGHSGRVRQTRQSIEEDVITLPS